MEEEAKAAEPELLLSWNEFHSILNFLFIAFFSSLLFMISTISMFT